ncbi:hypothetical protein V8G54_006873 [Vigna mungo]|uniref:Uncharacterized protein n=1 Tax=Vigna mungo TaxID=3915 RepID=A0AAQ3P2D5_VIGMU
MVSAFILSTSLCNSASLSATAFMASTSATCAVCAHTAFFFASSELASATTASRSFSNTFTSVFTFISSFTPSPCLCVDIILVSASILAAFCNVCPSLDLAPTSPFILASATSTLAWLAASI